MVGRDIKVQYTIEEFHTIHKKAKKIEGCTKPHKMTIGK
jgi:hypothetical protein